MNDLKFTDLTEDKQSDRKEWVDRTRNHLAEEHKRWGESIYKTLTLANTGGIVVVASLIKNVNEFRSSVCLRLTLTFFVIGLVCTLLALRHEFAAVTKRLAFWDTNSRRYLQGEITLGQLYEPLRVHYELRPVDHVIGWAPGVFFVVGAFTGFLFLWT